MPYAPAPSVVTRAAPSDHRGTAKVPRGMNDLGAQRMLLLEMPLQPEAPATGLDRMEVYVGNGRALARQLRLVVITDVVVRAVEQVVHVECDLDALRDRVAGAQVQNRGAVAAHARIFDEWRRTEVTKPQSR